MRTVSISLFLFFTISRSSCRMKACDGREIKEMREEARWVVRGRELSQRVERNTNRPQVITTLTSQWNTWAETQMKKSPVPHWYYNTARFGLVYWGVTPQQQPGAYQGGEMMMMKSVIWWRKPEYPEETTDLRNTAIQQGTRHVGHVRLSFTHILFDLRCVFRHWS